MFSSSLCVLATALVATVAMPPPAEEMTESNALCKAAMVMTPRGPDMPIMKTCCSTDTNLTEGQCAEVLMVMNQGPAAMMKMNGGLMTKKAYGESKESMAEPEPEPMAQGKNMTQEDNAKTMKSGGESMEDNMGDSTTESAMEEEKMFTMEMMAAEPIIMKCLMKTIGLVSSEGVINKEGVRMVWSSRMEPFAGEKEKKKLTAALETCPLTSVQEMLMFPMCLVKTCALTA